MVKLSWKQLVNVHNRELAIWNNGRKKASEKDFLTVLGHERFQARMKAKSGQGMWMH